MSTTSFLLKVADVLDAVADEKSQLSTELTQIKEAKRRETITPMVDKISFVTGEDSEEVAKKLASVDDNVLDLLKGITGLEGGTIGGSNTKVAGVEMGSSARSAKADQDFANWILS
tara:strand:+ start:485 stop:832 length:348 start_codon:yes stop_codon:yes gene_type:complete